MRSNNRSVVRLPASPFHLGSAAKTSMQAECTSSLKLDLAAVRTVQGEPEMLQHHGPVFSLPGQTFVVPIIKQREMKTLDFSGNLHISFAGLKMRLTYGG